MSVISRFSNYRKFKYRHTNEHRRVKEIFIAGVVEEGCVIQTPRRPHIGIDFSMNTNVLPAHQPTAILSVLAWAKAKISMISNKGEQFEKSCEMLFFSNGKSISKR